MSARALRLVAGAGVLAVVFLAGLATATASHRQARPAITVIQATFDEATKTTFYEVHLNDPASAASTWTWDLEPPADDPACNKFEVVVEVRDRSRAAWHHADSDGCAHKGIEHLGRVEVSVVTGDYSCNATITGRTNHFGPEPQPCFKKPTTSTTTTKPKLPPKPTAPANPTATKDIVKAIAKYGKYPFIVHGVAAGIGAIVFIEVPPAAAFCAGVAALDGAIASGLAAVQQDPPDPAYKSIAKLGVRHSRGLGRADGVSGELAAALNALVRATDELRAANTAMLTSFERAQGAAKAHDRLWLGRQNQATARYAVQEATLLEARPALRLRVARAAEKLTGPRPVSVAEFRAAQQSVRAKGLPAQVQLLARNAGATPAELRSLRQAVAAASPRAIADVAMLVADPQLTTVERTVARRLRGFAAVLTR